MPEGKWIPDLTADMPLQEAARRVLEIRVQAVQRLIPLAVEQSHKDTEHIHQLRVATRRCRAALDLFADCLSSKAYEPLRKELRRLRRAAGDARDWDVFWEAVQERLIRTRGKEGPGLHWLAGQALAPRRIAQRELEKVCRKHLSMFRDTDESLQPLKLANSQQTLGVLARPHLLSLLDALEESAKADFRNYEKLHQVRISGKRLRYAMEIFADCFGTDLRECLYPLVEEMQEILGRANDHYVAGQRVAEMRDHARAYSPKVWPRWRAGVETFLRSSRQQLTKDRQQFTRFWKRWQTSNVRLRFLKVLTP